MSAVHNARIPERGELWNPEEQPGEHEAWLAERQAREDQVRAASTRFSSEFLAAIRRNNAKALLHTGMPNWTTDAPSVIGDMLCDDAMAASLINALSLTLNGSYNAGSDALLDWLQAAANKYGTDTAELEVDA